MAADVRRNNADYFLLLQNYFEDNTRLVINQEIAKAIVHGVILSKNIRVLPTVDLTIKVVQTQAQIPTVSVRHPCLRMIIYATPTMFPNEILIACNLDYVNFTFSHQNPLFEAITGRTTGVLKRSESWLQILDGRSQRQRAFNSRTLPTRYEQQNGYYLGESFETSQPAAGEDDAGHSRSITLRPGT